MKWFQLDSDMPHDPKIKAVVRALGPAGLGGLAGVWCHVAKHGDYPGRAVDRDARPLPMDEIQEASLLPADHFQILIDLCLRSGHFRRDIWERCHEIWIPAMERRADRYTQRQKKLQQPPLEGLE